MTAKAIELTEKGLPLSDNEKQKATMRATLCILYKKNGEDEKANKLASKLPHTRESREIIAPIVAQEQSEITLNRQIRFLLLEE